MKIEPESLLQMQSFSDRNFDKIPGSISIVINSRAIAKNPKNNNEPIHDAIITILIRLHQTLPSLLFPSEKDYNEDIFGVKFIQNRYALILVHGFLIFRHEKQGDEPLKNNIRPLCYEWGCAIQAATVEIIEQILEFDPKLDNHPVICELRPLHQATGKLLEDYRKKNYE
jgi:hypothetical protein